MSILLGAAGDGVPGQGEAWAAALRRFPTVGDVVKRGDIDYFIALGRKRIRYGGNQPHTCADGRYILTLDGWLANREDLAQALGMSGDLPDDRVIVAAALQQWGRGALVKMHGDFALAWWDKVERRLLLAVDRSGGRPLFYHLAGQRIYFASLVAPLFMNPQVPRILDPAMVARAAFTPTLDFENTCFQGVKQLLPAHLLEWTAGGSVRLSRYWQLDPGRRVRLRRDDDYVDAAREILDMVVKQALPREGMAVSLLSGGLDSSAVAATVARLTVPAPLHTITIRPDPGCVRPESPPNRFQDEWPIAQAVARMHPSMVTHGVHASLDGLEDSLRGSFFWTGRPPIHLLAGSWMNAGWRQARNIGASTVFVGTAGNATLSASVLPYIRPGLLDIPQALYMALLAGRHGWDISPFLRGIAPDWLRKLRNEVLRRGGPAWKKMTALRAEVAAQIGLDEIVENFQTGDRRVSWGRRRRMWLIERTWTGRTLSSCNHFRDGLERRDPLGDVRMAEFCMAIPGDQFTRFSHDRFLARRVLADRLPPETLTEKRRGRQGAEWFDWASRRRDFLSAELDGIAASSLGRELIDLPRLRSILANWPTDANAAEPRYHELMNVLGRGVAIGSFIRWAEGANM
jgi:asparagine synthase (glutamine-hydrolysing)